MHCHWPALGRGLFFIFLLATISPGKGNDTCPQLLSVYNDLHHIIITHRLPSGEKVTAKFADTNRGFFDWLGFGWEETTLYSMDSFDWDWRLGHARILDAGSSHGQATLDMRRLGFNAEGCDIRFFQRPPRSPYLFAADLTSIPRPNHSYDVIISTQSVLSSRQNIPIKVYVLKEFRRLLRHGGIIKISPTKLQDLLEVMILANNDLEIKYLRDMADETRLTVWTPAKLPRYAQEQVEVVMGIKGENFFVPQEPPLSPDWNWKEQLRKIILWQANLEYRARIP
jgi:SAM-dependent methyltransferase